MKSSYLLDDMRIPASASAAKSRWPKSVGIICDPSVRWRMLMLWTCFQLQNKCQHCLCYLSTWSLTTFASNLCFSDIAMTYLGYTGLALALSILALWLEGCDFDDDDEARLLGVGVIFASTLSWDFPQKRIFFVRQFCRLWRIVIHPCVCTGIFTWRYIIYALHIDNTCIHIVLVCVYTYVYVYTCRKNMYI